MKQGVTTIAMAMCLLITAFAQESKPPVDITLQGNLVSRHIWRGLEIGKTPTSPATPHIQPAAAFHFALNNTTVLSLGFVGTYGTSNDYSESDFSLGIANDNSLGTFALMLFDYHYPYKRLAFTNFDGDGKGAHTIELSLTYKAPEPVNIRLFLSNNIHNVLPDDNTFYAELSYPVYVEKGAIHLFAGAAAGMSTWHGIASDGFELNNVGFKGERMLTSFDDASLSGTVLWSYNPYKEISYLALGLSVHM